MPLEDGGRMDAAQDAVVVIRSHALEGVMAFLEKRDPRWMLRVGRDWPDPWPG